MATALAPKKQKIGFSFGTGTPVRGHRRQVGDGFDHHIGHCRPLRVTDPNARMLYVAVPGMFLASQRSSWVADTMSQA